MTCETRYDLTFDSASIILLNAARSSLLTDEDPLRVASAVGVSEAPACDVLVASTAVLTVADGATVVSVASGVGVSFVTDAGVDVALSSVVAVTAVAAFPAEVGAA